MLSGCLNLIIDLLFQLCLVNEDLQTLQNTPVCVDGSVVTQAAGFPARCFSDLLIESCALWVTYSHLIKFSEIYLSHFVQYYTLKHKPATWRHEIFTHTHKHEQAHSILCKLRPSVPAGNEHVKEGTQWRALWGMTAPFKTSW